MFNLFHRTLGIAILSLGSKAYPLCMVVQYYTIIPSSSFRVFSGSVYTSSGL